MSKYLSITLSIFILGCIAGITVYWTRAFYNSVQSYQSPVHDEAQIAAQPLTLSQRTKVVVVLVGGLSETALDALEWPALSTVAQSGAYTVIQSNPPTYSQTAWVTLVTGAPSETNGAPPFDLPLEQLQLVTVDTIFARAHAAQLKTGLFGPSEWRYLLPRNHLDETFFTNASGPESDLLTIEAALPSLRNSTVDLAVIHLTQLDYAARQQGGPAGTAYRQAAQNIDGYIDQINRAIILDTTALIILGDHGHIDSGGYGGAEIELLRQPLVAEGNLIIPGTYSDVWQTDIAPTITTLLGIAPPIAAQGRALFEILDVSQENQATTQLALAYQRALLAKAYLTNVAGLDTALPASLFEDLAQVQTAFIQNNLSGAIQLAQLTREMADTQLAITRSERIKAEQLPRFLVSGFIFITWTVVMWRRRGAYTGLIIVATAITIGLYHALYQIQGFGYSLSYLSNFTELPFSIARRTAVSFLAGGGLLLIVLMLADERKWVTLLGTAYGFGVLVTFVFSIPLFWAFWQNGFVVEWYLPTVGSVFWQVISLLETLVASLLALILPWPIVGLILFVTVVRRTLDKTQPQPEPDVLPGLHL